MYFAIIGTVAMEAICLSTSICTGELDRSSLVLYNIPTENTLLL